ncbi:hypothetical protein BH10PSE7_BH10PSE7_15060 [soil metagenome]
MITNQDRRAIRQVFEKVRQDVEPLYQAKVRQLGGEPSPHIMKIMIAQNAMRCCMEEIYNEYLPYDDFFCGEMAVRLAAYSVSCVPIERQEALLVAVQEALPATLANKLKEGAVLKTTWITDGVEHPNVPEKGDVQ